MKKIGIRHWWILAPALLASLVVLADEAANACMRPVLTSPGRLYNSCVMDFASSSADEVGAPPQPTFSAPLPPASPYASGVYARTGSIRIGQ